MLRRRGGGRSRQSSGAITAPMWASRWVTSMPASSARSTCARSSTSTAAGSAWRRTLATSRHMQPASSVRPADAGGSLIGAPAVGGFSAVSVRCTPRSSDGSAAAMAAISANPGHGTITDPLVTVPFADSSTKATLAPWHMPTSSTWITTRRVIDLHLDGAAGRGSPPSMTARPIAVARALAAAPGTSTAIAPDRGGEGARLRGDAGGHHVGRRRAGQLAQAGRVEPTRARPVGSVSTSSAPSAPRTSVRTSSPNRAFRERSTVATAPPSSSRTATRLSTSPAAATAVVDDRQGPRRARGGSRRPVSHSARSYSCTPQSIASPPLTAGSQNAAGGASASHWASRSEQRRPMPPAIDAAPWPPPRAGRSGARTRPAARGPRPAAGCAEALGLRRVEGERLLAQDVQSALDRRVDDAGCVGVGLATRHASRSGWAIASSSEA